MKKEKLLKQIKKDLKSGNLGRARDRYHTLMLKYPDDLEIREGLAELYFKLNLPAKAGRYWYLSSKKEDGIRNSIEIFEKSCGNDPYVILSKLQLNLEIEKKVRNDILEKINRLKEECLKKHGHLPEFKWKEKSKTEQRKEYVSDLDKLKKKDFSPAFRAFLIIITILMIAGVLYLFAYFLIELQK